MVRFLIGSISCKRRLSLCILGGCLRKVRLYSTSDIGIETTGKRSSCLPSFASSSAISLFFGGTDSLFLFLFRPSTLFSLFPRYGLHPTEEQNVQQKLKKTSKYIENSNISVTLTFTSVGAKLGGTAAVVHVRKSNTELKQYNIIIYLTLNLILAYSQTFIKQSLC